MKEDMTLHALHFIRQLLHICNKCDGRRGGISGRRSVIIQLWDARSAFNERDCENGGKNSKNFTRMKRRCMSLCWMFFMKKR